MRVEIADTGPGIPQEAQGRLFQMFYTAGKMCIRDRRQSARRLGLVKDEERCGRDSERLSAALQCAWDGECGYFIYVLHDDEGRPQGFLDVYKRQVLALRRHQP